MAQPSHSPPDMLDPAPARPRIGRYEILERIATGGMAEAFRARAHGPGGYQRELVIKRILPHLAENADFVRAFVDEAKILGMLNHPNVVGVYDFGEDDGRHYLALEFLDGPSLRSILERAIRRGELLPPGLVAYIGKEICHGLSAVHRARDAGGELLGLIHRDVTPSNVMTTFNGDVKLLDFGVARITAGGPVTQDGRLKGKPGYFAPEQITGGAIDARVDLFALGVVLHELPVLAPPVSPGRGGAGGSDLPDPRDGDPRAARRPSRATPGARRHRHEGAEPRSGRAPGQRRPDGGRPRRRGPRVRDPGRGPGVVPGHLAARPRDQTRSRTDHEQYVTDT